MKINGLIIDGYRMRLPLPQLPERVMQENSS